jgi:hypothetical protein
VGSVTHPSAQVLSVLADACAIGQHQCFLFWRVLMPPSSKYYFPFAKIHHICLLLVFLSAKLTHIYYLYLDVKFKYISQPHKTN